MCAAGSAKSQTHSPLAHTSLKFPQPGESEQPPAVRLECGSRLQEEKAEGRVHAGERKTRCSLLLLRIVIEGRPNRPRSQDGGSALAPYSLIPGRQSRNQRVVASEKKKKNRT